MQTMNERTRHTDMVGVDLRRILAAETMGLAPDNRSATADSIGPSCFAVDCSGRPFCSRSATGFGYFDFWLAVGVECL